MSCLACKGTGRLWVHTDRGGDFIRCPMCPIHRPHTSENGYAIRITPLPTDLQGYRCSLSHCPQKDTVHFHVKV